MRVAAINGFECYVSADHLTSLKAIFKDTNNIFKTLFFVSDG